MWSQDSCLSRNCCVSCVGDYTSPQRPTWQHKKVAFVDKWPLWRGSREGWGGGGMTSSVSVLLGSNVLH